MKLLKELRKKITADWGKQCKDFSIECSVCQVHFALTVLEQKYDLGISRKKYKESVNFLKKLERN